MEVKYLKTLEDDDKKCRVLCSCDVKLVLRFPSDNDGIDDHIATKGHQTHLRSRSEGFRQSKLPNMLSSIHAASERLRTLRDSQLQQPSESTSASDPENSAQVPPGPSADAQPSTDPLTSNSSES